MKKTLYLHKSGVLKQVNFTVCLEGKNNKEYFPIHQIDTIHVFGECTFNKRFLQLMDKYNIDMHFYSYGGKHIGSFHSSTAKLGKILIEQVRAYDDTTVRNTIAKSQIYAGIHNCLSVLKYYEKKGYSLGTQVEQLEHLLEKIKGLDLLSKTLVEDCMLLEAKAKKCYYSAFESMLSHTPFCFEYRSLHPAHNEVNAMLSFGYALVYSDVLGAIDRSNLLPEIAFIHSNARQSKTLQYDLADIFKPVIVDRMILRMLHRGQLKIEDFTKSGDGFYFTEEAKHRFVEEYDTLMKSTVIDSRNGRHYSYKQLYSREVYALQNYILKKDKYKPYLMKW